MSESPTSADAPLPERPAPLFGNTWIDTLGPIYFVPSEFDQPGVPGSGLRMDRGFIKRLNDCRKLLGRPMIVTSGYRSREYDEALCARLGKTPVWPNAHVNGHAADIACSGARERYGLVRAALAVGFTRIGFDAGHVHIDDDPALVGSVMWLE